MIAVIGAGVIGRGVAQAFAQSGFATLLVDVSRAALDNAMAEIRQNVRLYRLFQKDKLSGQAEVIDRITPSTDFALLRDAEFVVENVTEKADIKEKVYRQIDSICQAQCIFAANTSVFPITRIATWTERPQQVIGIHFMNPVPLKAAVEVIPGYLTNDQTISRSREILAKIGKESIVVNDSPGFVLNRVLMLTINEAIFLVQENVSSADDIDRLFKNCLGHPMGPLETADLIGLDTILFSIEALYESFNDSKYRPCPLLKKMVDAGLRGKKTGKGFYTYA